MIEKVQKGLAKKPFRNDSSSSFAFFLPPTTKIVFCVKQTHIQTILWGNSLNSWGLPLFDDNFLVKRKIGCHLLFKNLEIAIFSEITAREKNFFVKKSAFHKIGVQFSKSLKKGLFVGDYHFLSGKSHI